ncbi:MAG: MFS transporter [Agathobacter sp.]|nr:MFS transporter [Agathobacter sp.]
MKKLEKNEVLLWFGSWTSKIGNIVFDYANSMSIVSSFSGKTWILALYQSSETIIQIIFNLIGGAKADKGSRKKIVIITDILAAIVCAVLSFFVDTGCMAEVMICANAILAVIYAFNSPTYKSIIREMVKKNRIGFYNSVSNAGGELIGIAGPIIGVGLVQIIGTRGALLFDAGTFLLSAFAESLLKRVIEVSKPENEKNNVISDIMDGFKYLIREKEILFLVILAALVNFFLAGYNLLLPYTDAFSFFVNMRSVKSYALVGGGIIMLSMIGLIVNKINKKKCNLH